MTANTKKRNMVRVKQERRFWGMFFVALIPSLFIMTKTAYLVELPWYVDVVLITLTSLAFSLGLGLLATMRMRVLKQNVLSLFLAGTGIILSLVVQLIPEASYWDSFMVLAILVLVAGFTRKDSMNSFH